MKVEKIKENRKEEMRQEPDKKNKEISKFYLFTRF